MAKLSKFIFQALVVTLFLAGQGSGAQSGIGPSAGELAGAALTRSATFAAAPAKKGTSARSKASGSAGKAQICFQPGVGWQRLTAPASGRAGQANGVQAVHEPRQGQSTTLQVTKPAFSRPSGSAQRAEESCSAALPGPPANGTTPMDKSRPVNPAGSTFAEFGNAPAGSAYGTNTPGLGDASGGILGGANAPSSLSGFGVMPLGYLQSSGTTGKSYISPLETRRLLRDSPGLGTRIRARRQLEGLLKKPAPIESSSSERAMRHGERQSARSTNSRNSRSQRSGRVSHP
jgi:hypothetical protein